MLPQKQFNVDSNNFNYDSSDSESYKKFMKKDVSNVTQQLAKLQKSPDYSVAGRPKTSRGILGEGHFESQQKASALDRFSALEAKIKGRLQTLRSTNLSASSDYDIDLSSDSDVKQSIGKENVKLRHKIKPKLSMKSKEVNLNIADFSSSSEDSSLKMRFLKNKSTPYKESSSETPSYTSDKKKKTHSSLAKKVTFVSPSPDTSSVSLNDFMPKKSVSEDDISSLDDFAASSNIHNVMTLDDLFVAEPMTDENKEENQKVKYSSDFEVSTERLSNYSTDKDQKSSSSDDNNHFLNVQGIEELQGFDAPQDIVGNYEKVSSISEVKSEEKQQYSDDFHDDDTLKETDSISVDSVREEIEEIITDSTISEEISQKSSTNSTITNSSYSSSTIAKYTSEFSEEIVPPKSTEVKTPISLKPKTDVCTQTVDFNASDIKDGYSFIPHRLIKDEAIDILTTYNPATLAIQDLLKQQVNITKEFVAQSRWLHDLTNSSIPCDYVYGAVDISSLQRYRRLMEKHNRDDS